MDQENAVKWKARAGCRLSLYSGEIEYGFPDGMSTLHFYRATKGMRLELHDKAYEFAVATYELTFDQKYIYTYDYQKEENWTTYRGDLTPDSYRQEPYEFQGECFYRVNLKRMDGEDFRAEEEARFPQILTVAGEPETTAEWPDYFVQEAENTFLEVKNVQREDSLVLTVLTDSHYTVNGTWMDTTRTIQSFLKCCNDGGVSCEGILHLGDITDGMVSWEVNRDYVNMVRDDLSRGNVPFYFCMGNHDSNYFRGNKEALTKEYAAEFYQEKAPDNVHRKPESNDYYADFSRQKIRMVCLESFDQQETVRYGFTEATLDFLEQVLADTPEEYGVLVCSHVPPLARIHYWSDEIRGSERLFSILRDFHGEGRILAYIHGHNHADMTYWEEKFPIISIGCSKCECFYDKKPEGSFTPERKLHTLSQELWDVLVISNKARTVDLIRYGAGENRNLTV